VTREIFAKQEERIFQAKDTKSRQQRQASCTATGHITLPQFCFHPSGKETTLVAIWKEGGLVAAGKKVGF
jgi:hypothetical protein